MSADLKVKEVKRPVFIPKNRTKGSAAAGMGFERGLKKALPKGARNSVWLEIEEGGRKKWKCLDWIVPAIDPQGRKEFFLLEVKLKNAPAGTEQVLSYLPYVRELYGVVVIPVVVVKFLGESGETCDTLREAKTFWERKARVPVIYYPGSGRI